MAEDKTIVTKKTAPKPAAALKKVTASKKPEKATAPAEGARESTPPATAPARAAKTKAVSAGTTARQAAAMPETAPAATTRGKSTATKTPAAGARTKKTAAKEVQRESAPAPISLRLLANLSDEERLHMIHEAAYFRAEKRRFMPGHEVEDWAAAEREIDALIADARRLSGR
jgi:hypothetical protein